MLEGEEGEGKSVIGPGHQPLTSVLDPWSSDICVLFPPSLTTSWSAEGIWLRWGKECAFHRFFFQTHIDPIGLYQIWASVYKKKCFFHLLSALELCLGNRFVGYDITAYQRKPSASQGRWRRGGGEEDSKNGAAFSRSGTHTCVHTYAGRHDKPTQLFPPWLFGGPGPRRARLYCGNTSAGLRKQPSFTTTQHYEK